MKAPILATAALFLLITSLSGQKRTHDEHMLRSINTVFEIAPLPNDVTGNIWYRPHVRESTKSKDAVYFFFARKDSVAQDLYIRIQHRADFKLLVQTYVFIIDGQEFEIYHEDIPGGPDSKSFKFDWVEIKMVEKHAAFLKAITQKSNIEVKMIGERQFFTEPVIPVEVQLMYKVLDYYRLFGGTLPPE